MACLFLLLSGYLDSLDGAYARLTSKTSQKGAVLDIISDRIVELAIVIGLYLLHPEIRDLAIVLMLGSMFLCITSFLVVGIFNQNDGQKSFHYSPGIIERPETFLFFIAMIFLPQFFSLLAFIFVCLVLLTAFVRLRQFFK